MPRDVIGADGIGVDPRKPRACSFAEHENRYHNGQRPTNRTRVGTPLFLPENLERSRPLIEVLREVAAVHRVTPAQIALAWAIHPPAVAAIPGAASVRQLEDNVAAAEIGLADDEYKALATAADEFQPVGGPMAGLPDRTRARFSRN